MASRVLQFDLLGNDVSASRAFDHLGRKAEELGAKSAGIGPKVAMIGKAFIGVAGTVAVAAGAATKMAGDFQSSMEKIHTQAGVSQGSIKGLGDGVLKLAGQVGQGPTSLATALYHIESSFASTGITGAKAMELLKISAEGAKIGGANLVDVTNALDSAVVSGISGVENYSQAMGVLNATVGSGDMAMQDLADAFGTGVLAGVKGFGVTLKDVGAALATFGDNNIRGAEAGTQLRMAILSLVHPSKDGVGVLKQMGVTVQGLTHDMQTGGLNKAMTDLHDHMQKAGITGSKVGSELVDAFGRKAGVGLSVLLGQFDRFQSKYVDITKGSKNFGDAWTQTTKTFNFQLSALEDSAKALGIRLGEKLLPAASSFLATITKAMSGSSGLFGHAASRTVVEPGQRSRAPVMESTAATGIFKLRDEATPVLHHIGDAVHNLFLTFAPLAAALAPVATAMLKIGGAAVISALEGTSTVLKALTGFMKDHKVVFSSLVLVVGTYVGVMKAATIAQTVFIVVTKGVQGAIATLRIGMWLLNVAFEANPIGIVVTALAALAVGLIYAYKHSKTFRDIVNNTFTVMRVVVMSVLGAVTTGIVKSWNVIRSVTSTVWNAIRTVVSAVMSAVRGVVTTVLGGIAQTWIDRWHGVRSVVTAAWAAIHAVVSAGVRAVSAVISAVTAAVAALWTSNWGHIRSIVTGAWTLIRNVVSGGIHAVSAVISAVTGAISHVWSGFWSGVGGTTRRWLGDLHLWISSGLDGVKGLFSGAVNAIGTIWSGIYGKIKGPIHAIFGWIQRYVLNPLNSVTGHFGMPPMHIPNYAEGGVHGVRPGYTPGRDTHLIAVGGGEAIMRPEWTKAVGPRYVDRMNSAARTGGVDAVRQHLADGGQAFQFGGIFNKVKHVVGDVGNVAGNVLSAIGGAIGSAGSTIMGWIAKGAEFAIGHVVSPLINKLANQFGSKPDIPVGMIQHMIHAFGDAAKHWGKDQDAANAAAGGGGGIMNFSKVLAWVMGHLGIPYHYGGTDCSWFTQGAEGAGGVRIPRTAAAQQAMSKAVSRASLIAGDLGFVGRPAHHVGVYLGSGRWAAEHHTGSVSSINGGDGWDNYGRVGSPAGGNFMGGGAAGSSANEQLGRKLAVGRGWAGQLNALDQLWTHESGWRNTAQNPSSSAYGIPQFLDSTWAGTGYRKTSDPRTQILAGFNYIASRYGDPNRAWGYWQQHHSYEKGTPFVQSTGPAILHRGEAVIPAAHNKRGGDTYYTINVPVHVHGSVVGDKKELATMIVGALDVAVQNGIRGRKFNPGS